MISRKALFFDAALFVAESLSFRTRGNHRALTVTSKLEMEPN